MKYDILFTASVYKSTKNALRFVKSIKHIDGNHICVLVSPLEDDVKELESELKKTKDLGCRVVVFHSTVDNIYQGRGWGFVWAVASDISAKYLCSGDDDIEFIEESYDIVERLDANEFSVMTFNATGYDYGTEIAKPEWLNGDTMFTHFEDNLKYGVADALPSYPVSFFTEIEYQQRMSYFTGRWLVKDYQRHFYKHHFRCDEELTNLRSLHAGPGMRIGKQLWKEKYGIEFNDVHIDCEKLYEQVSTMPEKMKSHFIFYGMWNNWAEIYWLIYSFFRLVIDTENI